MKYIDIAIFSACVAAYEDTHSDSIHEDIMRFLFHINKYNLKLETWAEFEFRKALFFEAEGYINKTNAEMGPNSRFKLGHNKFSTWSEQERARLFVGNRHFMNRQDPEDEVCGVQRAQEIEE